MGQTQTRTIFKKVEPREDNDWEEHHFIKLYKSPAIQSADPVRTRKNPYVEPAYRDDDNHYSNPAQTILFNNWVAKEWAVYCGEITLIREEFNNCMLSTKVNHEKYCGHLGKRYMSLIDKGNLIAAKRMLRKGIPLVTDKYVFGLANVKSNEEPTDVPEEVIDEILRRRPHYPRDKEYVAKYFNLRIVPKEKVTSWMQV